MYTGACLDRLTSVAVVRFGINKQKGFEMTIDSQRFDRDLMDMLKRNEGKTLEFKRDLSSSDKVVRTLVAFSNTAGGILLIGVEDKTRAVCGVLDALKEEERLANIISDNIEPRLAPEIEIIRWRKTQAELSPGATIREFLIVQTEHLLI